MGFFNLAGILVGLCVVPAALAAFGRTGDALFLERAVGAFGAPGSLLLVALGLLVLRVLFGSGELILPQLAGTLTALFFFAGAFNLPWLGAVRSVVSGFPGFGSALPPLAAGVAAAVLGIVLSLRGGKGSGLRALAVPAVAITVFVAVGGSASLPKVDPATLSVDASIRKMADALGKEYRDPEVDAAVKKVLDESGKDLEAKKKEIEELAQRLEKAVSDKDAIARKAGETEKLSMELSESRKKLEELTLLIQDTDPVLPGGSYPKAVQPLDSAVRDFSVSAALSSPGAFDDPQGSRQPTVAGLRQTYLVHAAVSSKWKYVSDLAVSWSEYVSPARRTIKLGLAGDCDDFATLVASCVASIGGRTRIVHGFDSKGGHAWAELYLGNATRAKTLLREYASRFGSAAQGWSLTVSGDGSGWLCLDWNIGQYSSRATSVTVAWEGK